MSLTDAVVSFSFDVIKAQDQLVGNETITDRIAYSSIAIGVNNASALETNVASLILTSVPVYVIQADDIVMKVSEANQKMANNTLYDFLREKANAIVSKDGVVVEQAIVSLEIINQPMVFEAAVYDVLLTYIDASGGYNTTTIKLTLLADRQAELPNTGVRETGNYYVVALITVLGIGILWVINKRRKK